MRADRDVTYLEERILLLDLKLVGAEELETAVGLLVRQTVLITLEQLEDVIDHDSLQVDLLLVVEVLGLELNLRKRQVSIAPRGQVDSGKTYLGHVNLGVLRTRFRWMGRDGGQKKHVRVGLSSSSPKSLYSLPSSRAVVRLRCWPRRAPTEPIY